MKRYDLHISPEDCGYDCAAHMEDSFDGEWIKADEALNRIDELTAENERLKDALRFYAEKKTLLRRSVACP